jgi:L-lactate dehydrogenase complex protein LldG
MTDTSARHAILGRIQNATHSDTNPYASLPRHYVQRGSLDARGRQELMMERLREYGANVVECPAGDVQATIAHQLRLSGRHVFVVPPDLPGDWLVDGFSWKVDNHLSYEEIEQCEGVVTGASAGIADSGTIVLHHKETEGRRVISLLPDFHLCILSASQIVETLPEYFARCAEPPSLATFISGPSATADIEMTRIKGVHGPRLLSVIIVRDEG